MKEYLKNNWAMYSILLLIFVFIVGQSIYGALTAYEEKESCSIYEQQSLYTYTYDIEGSSKQIEHLALHIEREFDNNLTSEQAGNLANTLVGDKISYITNSQAIKVTFKPIRHSFHLYIDITPALLTTYDYEYLNANGLILVGTINWNTTTVEALAQVLTTEGYTCQSN